MKDKELQKLWKDNLSENQFDKINSELKKINLVETNQEFRVKGSWFMFAPILVSLVSYVLFATYQKEDNSLVYKSIEKIKIDNSDLYEYDLMEELI